MSKEPVALLEVRFWDDGKECYYKTLADDLPLGTYELYLSTPEPEVKRKALNEDEVDSLFNCDETSPEYEHGFRDGIWFAEKHHGIGGGE